MNKHNVFNDLVRFSERRKAKPMIALLKENNITFKLTRLFPKQILLWPWVSTAVVIQVESRDFNRAEAMLIEYQKTMGIPMS